MTGEPRTRSLLEYHVLLALGEGPLHGYGICRAAAEESGGWVAPRAGSLYRIIARLAHRGLVEESEPPGADDASNPGRPRKYYALTPAGRATLRRESQRLSANARLARRRLGLEGGDQ